MTNPPHALAKGLQLLKQAQACAKAGDASGMIEALMASGFVAGLVRKLQATYPRLDRADLEDAVAVAMAAAFEAVSGGKRVTELGGWLSKAASNEASDRWETDHARRRSADGLAEDAAVSDLDDDERERRVALAEHRRTEAVRLARRLLPRVGQGQVADVMAMVIDAVESRNPDFSPQTVADVLAISSGAARKLMSRGMERLRRAARDEGIELPDDISADPALDRTPDTLNEETT